MDVNFDLYDGKSFKDLLKDIVSNSENKKQELGTIISELKELIKTANDAVILSPVIQSYLDISVKNDEQLVKLAAVIQRLLSARSETTNGSIGLTDEEKNQIFKNLDSINLEIKTEVDPLIPPKNKENT